MSLKTYRKKRNFSKTREPDAIKGKSRRANGAASFVVQEHHASHLHFDFRLELEGVLKSWAVPKGPPTEPKQKRLAVQVEDHPVAYGKFEGEIPEGEYGGGHVLIWDRGTWLPKSKSPASDIKKGRLEFTLDGEKLKGSWLLVRSGGEKSKNWFLIKRSKEVAAEIPDFVEPQLAQLVNRPPEGGDWIHEIKFDGYRTLCRIENGDVRFFTRSGLDWTEKYESLIPSFKKLKIENALIDGEIAVVDNNGRSDFHLLQEELKGQSRNRLLFYAFDLLHVNGEDVRELPLHQRKAKLKSILEKSRAPKILFSDHWTSSAAGIWKDSCSLGLEGIISKKASSTYESGRSGQWVKSKCVANEEFIVIGYMPSEVRGRAFSSLLLGAMSEGKLKYAGRVGTGFDQTIFNDLGKRLKSLKSSTAFVKRVPDNKDAVWVKPELIVQVRYAEKTNSGVLRHASYLGLREDKKPSEVQIEKPRAVAAHLSAASVSRSTSVKKLITHPERVVFTKEKITKRDLLDYYSQWSGPLLRYLADRPVSLLRCPSGANEKCFFQKHVAEDHESSLRVEKVDLREQKGNREEIISIHSDDGLRALVQMGVIEIHSWGSHRNAIERPDMLVFDLDPDERVGWSQVCEGAWRLKDLLGELGLKTFLKTTGGKGLHLHVPIAPKYTWAETKLFAKTIAANLEREEPKLYSSELLKVKRRGRIFIDYLRNGYGATAVAPYSVRARTGAAVAMPIAWNDLSEKLSPDEFRLKDLLNTKPGKDPWRGMYDLEQPIELLETYRNQK